MIKNEFIKGFISQFSKQLNIFEAFHKLSHYHTQLVVQWKSRAPPTQRSKISPVALDNLFHHKRLSGFNSENSYNRYNVDILSHL